MTSGPVGMGGDASVAPVAVTVVVPTFRRPAGLAALLAGLSTQVDPGVAWDVVVVDNDPPRATVPASFPVPLRLVPEPTPGSAHARNRGIAEASGDVIAMVDDDVVPAADWLARLVEPILAGRCDGAGGRVELDPTVARPAWFDESGIGGYLTSFDPAPAERLLGEREYVVTANAAFRTHVLRATGGFDPALGPTGTGHLVADDVLVTRRFMEVGGRMAYVPSALVVHELPAERLRRRWILRRAWSQGRSDWRLDRPTLERRRLNGARVATSWLTAELARRRAEGLGEPGVRFHLACDVVRTAGALREAASWSLPGAT